MNKKAMKMKYIIIKENIIITHNYLFVCLYNIKEAIDFIFEKIN